MQIISNAKFKKWFGRFMFLFLIYVVAAASFSGFFQKYAFNERNKHANFELMLEGSAYRPFVHRRLMIDTAKMLADILPPTYREKIENKEGWLPDIYTKVKLPQGHHADYYALYIITFSFWLVGLIALYAIIAKSTHNTLLSLTSTMIFAVIFPLLQTNGGLFYDFGEILFMSVAIYLAWDGRCWLLLLLIPFAEYNKESFLWFLPALYPFLRTTLNQRKALSMILLGVIIAGLTYLPVRAMYSANPGGIVVFQLWDHLSRLFYYGDFKMMEYNYGIKTGAHMFIGYIVAIAWLFKNAWKHIPALWRQHFWIVATIQIPLYMLFCYPGELRNLSFFWPFGVILIATYLQQKTLQQVK